MAADQTTSHSIICYLTVKLTVVLRVGFYASLPLPIYVIYDRMFCVIVWAHRYKPREQEPALNPTHLRGVECSRSSLVKVRRVFRVTDELCQNVHSLDKEWPDLIDLHRTKTRKLGAYKERSR